MSFQFLHLFDSFFCELEMRNILITISKGILEKNTDQLGKAWVTAMNPSALSNTVGLVLNFLTIELMEILENCFLEKIRVDCCNTINCV